MAIDTTTSVDVQTLTPFKKFIMTIGTLPTSYLESMTYAELLMWFCNYLQETVIPTVNNNAEAVEELQGLYEELRTYVNDYFDNLDVQEEINNKLDTMAQDGSLTNLIKNYIDPIQEEFETTINNNINSLQTQVNSIASGSPLVATSTSGMTDTSRVYVNTTDGKWYYYNGTAWSVGGTYQSTGIDDYSITGDKIKKNSLNANKIINVNGSYYDIFKNSIIYDNTRLVDGVKTANNTFKCTELEEIEPNTIVRTFNVGIDVVDLVCYDNSRGYLETIRLNGATAVTLSSSTAYIALSFRTTSADYFIHTYNTSKKIQDDFYSNEFKIDTNNYKENSITPYDLIDVQKQPIKDILKFTKWYNNTRWYENLYIYNSLYKTSDYIRVNPSKEITFSRAMEDLECVFTFDENKQLLNNSPITTGSYTPGTSVRYLILTLKKNLPITILQNSNSEKIKIDWLNTSDDTLSISGIAFGDSLWSNSQGNYNYPDTPYNQSTGECIGYDDYLSYSGINIDNRGVSGQTLPQGLSAIKNISLSDLNNKDFIIISYGRNDFRNSVNIGNLATIDTTFDETTFIGALQSAIEHLQTIKPTLKIILWTPTQSNANGYGIYTTNSVNKKLIDYVKAYYDVGQLYSCDIVDMYSYCGINMVNLEKFTFEGVHLTNDGYEYSSSYYVNKMVNILK